MSWNDRGNSREAWETAFSPGGHWDEVGGDAITALFGKVLVEHLAPDAVAYLGDHPNPTILDWGCARGQMTAALRARFPHAYVAGLDFAWNAVEAAIETYGMPFIYEADGRIRGRWDVLVVSNCLEHMTDPLATVQRQLASAHRYYVAMVPFMEELGPGAGMSPQERDRAGHAHVQRFDSRSFPDEVGGWRRIQHEPVEVRGAWNGIQLVVTYERVG